MDKQKQIEEMAEVVRKYYSGFSEYKVAEEIYRILIPEGADFEVLLEDRQKLQKEVEELKAFQKDIQIEFFKALNQESEITKANVEARCADRIQELEEALLDMVAQFCEMGEEGKLCHTFMSAEEQAFDVLGIKYGEDIDEVYKRFNDKWNAKNQKWECF